MVAKLGRPRSLYVRWYVGNIHQVITLIASDKLRNMEACIRYRDETLTGHEARYSIPLFIKDCFNFICFPSIEVSAYNYNPEH